MLTPKKVFTWSVVIFLSTVALCYMAGVPLTIPAVGIFAIMCLLAFGE